MSLGLVGVSLSVITADADVRRRVLYEPRLVIHALAVLPFLSGVTSGLLSIGNITSLLRYEHISFALVMTFLSFIQVATMPILAVVHGTQLNQEFEMASLFYFGASETDPVALASQSRTLKIAALCLWASVHVLTVRDDAILIRIPCYHTNTYSISVGTVDLVIYVSAESGGDTCPFN